MSQIAETEDTNLIAERRQQAMNYWLTRLSRGHDGSGFPPDRFRPRVRSHNLARVTLPISTDGWSTFVAVCTREGIKVSIAVLGLLQILLHRYTFADTIEVGTYSGHVLAVSAEIAGSSSVRNSLKRTSLATAEAQAHSCSWAELQACIRQAGSQPDRPLFRVLLSIASLVSVEGNSEIEIEPQDRSRCDLMLSLRSRGIETGLEAEYDSDLYTRESVERILAQFRFLLDSLDAILDQSVDRIPLCPLDETRSLIQEIALRGRDFQATHCMHQRFEEQVRRTPDAIALVMPGDDTAGDHLCSIERVCQPTGSLPAIQRSRARHSGRALSRSYARPHCGSAGNTKGRRSISSHRPQLSE